MNISQGQDTFKDILFVVLANTAPFNGQVQSFRGAICTVPSGMDNVWFLLSLTCGLERKEECSAVDQNLLSDGGKYLRQFKYSDQNKIQKCGENFKC